MPLRTLKFAGYPTIKKGSYEMRTNFGRHFARYSLFLLLLTLLAFPAAHAQQTLGSINGTVLDASGAAIPGSTITVADPEIGVTRTATAGGNGYFQLFNLPIGSYTVQATHDGFDTSKVSGIAVQEARATTISVKLKVGEIATSVDVTANPMLNATDATNGYTLDKAQIALTPLATGSFTQLAVLSPGVSAELLSGLDSNAGLGNQPIWANGQRDTSNTFQVNGVDVTNLFNGKSSSGSNSQRYNFNIGGGSGSASSSAGSATIGGANPVGTSVYGSNGNSLPSPPPEFLQELRVNTSMYDAQQGATSGAQIDANTVSGTNQLHGQLFGSLANNDINADPFFFKQQALLTSEQGVGAFPASLANPYLNRNSIGATLGGPIEKNKLFFFLGYQFTYDSDQSTGLSQMTVPSGLTDNRTTAGIDAAAVSWAGGTGTYTTAINQTAFDLLNAKLPNGQYLIPSAQTPSAYAYGVPNVTLIGNSIFSSHQADAALDYQATKNDRLSGKYFYQNDPITRPYGVAQTGGFPVTQENGAQLGEIDNTILIGSRFNWEQRLGYVREFSYSYDQQFLPPDATSGSAFNGQPNYGIGSGEFGVNNNVLPGLLLKEFASNVSTNAPGLKVGPYSNFMNVGYFQNKLNPATNVIWSLGKHTLLAGGGYSYTQLNIEDQRNGLATINTKTFETFLQGTVQGSAVLYSNANGRNNANRYYRSNENDWYVQDKWQALPNLSITAGVRWDYHGGFNEKYGNMFNFNPSAYSVTGTVASGFTVNNSGFVIAGNNPNATPGATDSTLTGRQWGLSPRVAFAYAPKMSNNKVVFSGGAGIYYDRGELFNYLSQPAGNGSGGPFGVTESAPLANYVIGTGTTLAAPLGSAASASNVPTGKASYINTQLQQVLGVGPSATYGYSGILNSKYGQNCSGIENQEGYTDCPDALNFGAYNSSNVLPYTINYTLKMQWQPRTDLAVLLGYVGNRGRHSVIPIPFNEPGIATPTNPIYGETATYGFEVLNQNSLPDKYDYAPIAGEPWNSEDGGNTDFRTPYIGFSPNAALFKTVGVSAYDALQAQVQKQMSHHLQASVSYTWSHSLDEQSDIGLFFTGNNPNDLRSSYGSSDFDRTHVVTADFLATLPDRARPYSALSYITNGWSLTGIGIVQSGEPFSLYEFDGAVGSAYFGDYPTLLNPVLPISNPSAVKSALTGSTGRFRASGGNYIPSINPNDIAINYLQPGQKGVPVSTGSDPQDLYETDFTSGQRNIFRQALQKRLDVSFRKDFRISERFGLQYAFNIFNVFNTTSEDVPQNDADIRQSSACSNTAIAAGNNCAPKDYYVNYGQIVTSNSATDQQQARLNLDQIPITSGTGKGTTIPLYLQPGQGSCTTLKTVGTAGCPNNGANFGSVTGTIGGSRAVTMDLHITF
jgi:hypothetical protein